MVKRIKQKLRKQAHDPDFEYQPMTKAKEDTRNKTQTTADVPKPTKGTDEEKEKKNEKKKEEIKTETEPATKPEQKEGAHEAKQQQKEKMQEDIGQEKELAAETNPKEDANQEKTQLQVLESDDDFKEESIQNKPLAISCRKTNKQQHQLTWNKALFSNQGNMLSSQECKTIIASIEEYPQQTLHSNDCAIAVCNVINQYINWQPV
ncbi:nucleolar protein 58-like [Camellia sinensis]|uniref:nucleolar protein 58-like n=1 Tax=Camellia sinensis TaxID=4442 RepID=UPI0010356EEA|nr:nucleolar protein 58-like [Camellia sinensis]